MSKDVLKSALYSSLTAIIKEGVDVLVKNDEGSHIEKVPAGAPYYQAAIALLRVDEEGVKAPEADTLDAAIRRIQRKKPVHGDASSAQH